MRRFGLLWVLGLIVYALAQEDVADVPVQTLYAGDDWNKKYFLIGAYTNRGFKWRSRRRGHRRYGERVRRVSVSLTIASLEIPIGITRMQSPPRDCLRSRTV